ncbi:cobalt-precorrin-6A reductase [Umezawaea tangerina]|uniref:cobalt-precorrin-6A reductase n=1 Tax=Umezawaea tangerina TaxID=84725 RepID=UPI001FE5493D|nr:cobalt-precorrin-6A reductase [Umezawaea tangerina]
MLILGGTGEARRLAAELPGLVVSSLAGRVAEPRLPEGAVRVGGFGGVDGLVEWLRGNGITAVVDATHPFAARITANAVEATARVGIPLLVLRRPGWAPEPGDDWRWVGSLEEAAAGLPGGRVFLTTGRQDVGVFAGCPQFFLVRSVDPPEPPLPQRLHVLLDRGPFTVDGEVGLMREYRIDVLVTKDSGGGQTAAKLVAARSLGLPVVVVRRPPAPAAETVDSVAAAVAWVRRGSGGA